MTMKKDDLKSIYWLLFSSEALFNLWREVCQLWVNGKLPDSVGEVGKKRPEKKIIPGLFRCFEGEISEHDIMAVLKADMRKDALLKKDASSQDPRPKMEDLAKTLKLVKKLKSIIIEYLIQKHNDKFLSSCKWGDIVSLIPELGKDMELERCRRPAGEGYLGTLLRRNVAKEGCPTNLAVILKELYAQKFGGTSRAREVPFVAFLTENLMKTFKPKGWTEKSPTCPLAFVDFSQKETRQWEDCEIYKLFEYIVELPRNPTVVVVVTVMLGPLFSNVLLSMQKVV